MPQFDVNVSCPVFDSFHVQQVAGLFDVPLAERAAATFSADVPGRDEPWQIGLIVGSSGSGKSSIARAAFGDSLYQAGDWPRDKAVVDCFGTLPIKRITGLLTSVGLSSPPSWIKPYQVLSGGERFRCDLARALALAWHDWPTHDTRRTPEQMPIVAFDEFTSVVDRNVAQIGSAAISKALRSGNIPCRFVAVSCHYDIAEWLEPDWVLDMTTGECQRRRLRRPTIELELFRTVYDTWRQFAPHHYLSRALNRAARCYVALWQGRPVAFCGVLSAIGKKNYWRISRLVTLPDFQRVGIGMRVAEAVAELHRSQGHRLSVTASHPALVGHCARSRLWLTTRVLKTGSGRTGRCIRSYRSSTGRAVVSFEYVGQRSGAAKKGDRRLAVPVSPEQDTPSAGASPLFQPFAGNTQENQA